LLEFQGKPARRQWRNDTLDKLTIAKGAKGFKIGKRERVLQNTPSSVVAERLISR